MKSKETSTETRLNSSNYPKEFWYLDQLKWKIPFENLCTKPVLCKKNFFSTLARYIETQKKEKSNSWEKEIQNFIDSILNGNLWKWIDLLKNINIFFAKNLIKWYQDIWDEYSLQWVENSLKYIEYWFKNNSNWRTSTVICWVAGNYVPERFYEWTNDSWLLNEIREKNISDLANALSGKK